MNWQQPILRRYTEMPADEAVARIAARKAELGEKLIILGHHYQQDDVIRFADVTGRRSIWPVCPMHARVRT